MAAGAIRFIAKGLLTMSALPPKAEIRQRVEHVCFVPEADLPKARNTFDGTQYLLRWHECQSASPGCHLTTDLVSICEIHLTRSDQTIVLVIKFVIEEMSNADAFHPSVDSSYWRSRNISNRKLGKSCAFDAQH